MEAGHILLVELPWSALKYQTCCFGALQGYNANGQLGIGSVIDKSAPTQVGTLSDWVFVSASYLESCAIRASGVAFCWGEYCFCSITVCSLGPPLIVQCKLPVPEIRLNDRA